MPIDQKGTSPGLTAPPADAQKKVNMACRKPYCTGTEAVEVTPANIGGRHMYMCTKCRHTWGIYTGGSFDL